MGARSEQLKGARLGAYEIVRLIGHGATASVFEATHLSLDKPVAVKVLHEHLAANAQMTSRFVREGRVAARLQHPNIVNVLDVGTEHKIPYLVMELLSGGDLRALLAAENVLPAEHALDVLLPILSALAHAHAAGVIHRDLKPANVFLARDGRDAVIPKLVDFGLSKISNADGEGSALTSTGLVAGTALYMAPEQTVGVREFVTQSDQYATAAILYEAVTGRPPFSGEGMYALLERIRTAPLHPPSAVNPAVSKELDATIVRAMSRDPADRWPSIRAFARELLPFAGAATADLLARDFAERPSESNAIGSRPSLRGARARPEAETRALRGPKEANAVRETTLETRESSTSPVRPRGAAPCPPGKSPFHVKGLPYRGFMFHVGRITTVDAFLEELEPELRAFVQQPFLASRRYDIFPFVALFETLARVRGIPFEDLVRASTAAQVRYDARTAYRMILDANRPEDVVGRVNRFNAQIFDFGKYSATMTDDSRATVVFAEIPAHIESWFWPMHVSYATESLRLAGAADVTIVSRTGEDAGSAKGYPLRTYRTELRWKV